MTRGNRAEIGHLIDLVADIARDDTNTLAMLALLRNGHPGASIPNDTDIPYPDPTGEWGIEPDDAVQMGKTYRKLVQHAYDTLRGIDGIRRRMRPIEPPPDTPDNEEWCHNCLPHGHCSPRTADGGHYCKWCTSVKRAFGWLPPEHIVQLHHRGDRHKEVARALTDHAGRKK